MASNNGTTYIGVEEQKAAPWFFDELKGKWSAHFSGGNSQGWVTAWNMAAGAVGVPPNPTDPGALHQYIQQFTSYLIMYARQNGIPADTADRVALGMREDGQANIARYQQAFAEFNAAKEATAGPTIGNTRQEMQDFIESMKQPFDFNTNSAAQSLAGAAESVAARRAARRGVQGGLSDLSAVWSSQNALGQYVPQWEANRLGLAAQVMGLLGNSQLQGEELALKWAALAQERQGKDAALSSYLQNQVMSSLRQGGPGGLGNSYYIPQQTNPAAAGAPTSGGAGSAVAKPDGSGYTVSHPSNLSGQTTKKNNSGYGPGA